MKSTPMHRTKNYPALAPESIVSLYPHFADQMRDGSCFALLHLLKLKDQHGLKTYHT